MFKYKTFHKLNIGTKKAILMDFLKSKRGIVTHPAMMFIIALVLGLVLAYVWINYISIPNPFCPK